MTTQPDLCTRAWLLKGITQSLPGVLEMAHGRIAFTFANGERVFDCRTDEVRDIVFPWYYFGGGVKLRVGERRVRLSFVRPNDAEDIELRLLSRSQAGGPSALLTAGRKVLDIGEGRRAGKAWKALLETRG